MACSLHEPFKTVLCQTLVGFLWEMNLVFVSFLASSIKRHATYPIEQTCLLTHVTL